MYEFMKLLKRNNYNRNTEFTPISLDEWVTVVEQAKKRSASSIFSGRS